MSDRHPASTEGRRSFWKLGQDRNTVLADADPEDFWLNPDDFAVERVNPILRAIFGWMQTLLSLLALVLGLYGCFGDPNIRKKDPLIFWYIIGSLSADIGQYVLLGLGGLTIFMIGGYPSLAHAFPTLSMFFTLTQGCIFSLSAVLGVLFLLTDVDARSSKFLMIYVVIDVIQCLISVLVSLPLIVRFCITTVDSCTRRTGPIVQFYHSTEPDGFIRNVSRGQYDYSLVEMRNPYDPESRL
ncbi:MAG: uncharacterized protein KVP18_001278 [Porospora cf. gigantea A]|uniref:uncharacterized protein n=1 Tax=Porospora cf. gigantea A TaxID=2853593 RepID=UPI00355A459A|nr:MAG: hypothetical protein KVP18_001278 [Porospora cf. gigantea A]